MLKKPKEKKEETPLDLEAKLLKEKESLIKVFELMTEGDKYFYSNKHPS